MRVRILSVGGDAVDIGHVPDLEIAELIEGLEAPDRPPLLTFTLDDSGNVTHIVTAHVVRVDLYPRPRWRQRLRQLIRRLGVSLPN